MLIHFDSSRFQRMNPMTLVGFDSSFECYHSFYNFDICTTCQKLSWMKNGSVVFFGKH